MSWGTLPGLAPRLVGGKNAPGGVGATAPLPSLTMAEVTLPAVVSLARQPGGEPVFGFFLPMADHLVPSLATSGGDAKQCERIASSTWRRPFAVSRARLCNIRAGRNIRRGDVSPQPLLRPLPGGVGLLAPCPGMLLVKLKSCLCGRLSTGRNGEDAVVPEHVPQVTPKSELPLIAPPKANIDSVPATPGSRQHRWWFREGSVVVLLIHPSSCPGA